MKTKPIRPALRRTVADLASRALLATPAFSEMDALAYSSAFAAHATSDGNFRIVRRLIGRAFGRSPVRLRVVNSKTHEDFFRRNHPLHH